MPKQDNSTKQIRAWFDKVLKVSDEEQQNKFIDAFCEDTNFKVPTKLRKKIKSIHPNKLMRFKTQHISRKWSRFVQFISAYLVLAESVNNTQSKEEDDPTSTIPKPAFGPAPTVAAKDLVDSMLIV